MNTPRITLATQVQLAPRDGSRYTVLSNALTGELELVTQDELLADAKSDAIVAENVGGVVVTQADIDADVCHVPVAFPSNDASLTAAFRQVFVNGQLTTVLPTEFNRAYSYNGGVNVQVDNLKAGVKVGSWVEVVVKWKRLASYYTSGGTAIGHALLG